MRNLRALIRNILREEVSPRSLKTTLPPDDSMFNYKKFPGVRVEVFIVNGPNVNSFSASNWCAKITDEKENKTITRTFNDEKMANFFAQQEAEKIYRRNQGEENYPTNSLNYLPHIEK